MILHVTWNILWRGGRGKAERAKGRVGSETSGETVGKWMMINTCIWFQWLPERVEKHPAGRQRRSSSSEPMLTASERATHEEEREPTKKKRRVYVLLTVLFCVIKHLFWLVTLDFLVLPSLIPEPCYTYSWWIHFGLLKGPLTEKSKFPWFFEVIVLLKTSCKFQNSKLSQSKNSLYWSHSAKTTGCGIVRLNMDSAEDQCLFSSAHW